MQYRIVNKDGDLIATYSEATGEDGRIGEYVTPDGEVYPTYPRYVCQNTLMLGAPKPGPAFRIRRTVNVGSTMTVRVRH